LITRMPLIRLSVCLLLAGSLHADSFPQALFDALRSAEENQNIVFSPYGVTAVLAMAGAGARGDTAEQIARVLQLGDSPDTIVQQFAALQKTVEGASSPNVTLQNANALFPQQDYAFQPDYLTYVKRPFNGTVVPVDYAQQFERSCGIINQWVSEKTGRRIRELIIPGTLNAQTRLTLVNAIYFKAAWREPFDKRQTRVFPFTLPSGEVKDVPFMNKTAHFSYLETEPAQILDIPYIGNNLVLTLLLPKPGHTIGQALAPLFEARVPKLEQTYVKAAFPKFTFNAQFNLSATLLKLGMPDAFDEKADFSGMDGTRELRLSDVLHQAFIEVDEVGTTAAAATETMIALGSPPTQKTFLANRPFAFAIRVRDSGTILFLGILNDPAPLEHF